MNGCSYLKTPLQQQIGHLVGIFIQLSEGPPLPGALKDESSFIPMTTDRFGKDLGNGVLLSEMTPDVHLDPQEHTRRTGDPKERYFKNRPVHLAVRWTRGHMTAQPGAEWGSFVIVSGHGSSAVCWET